MRIVHPAHVPEWRGRHNSPHAEVQAERASKHAPAVGRCPDRGASFEARPPLAPPGEGGGGAGPVSPPPPLCTQPPENPPPPPPPRAPDGGCRGRGERRAGLSSRGPPP